MNAYTGEVVDLEALSLIEEPVRSQFLPILRDLSALEVANKQINLYSDCGCGSGKKFKFCCHKKP